MILSQQAQTIVKTIRSIPEDQLDQAKVQIQVRQDIEKESETIIIQIQNKRIKEQADEN